ncbi:GTPase Era [Sulfobacillus harzensis]|uniref:GTPase Era n=1 Tax=Sulfobacillus harzensis TaxID=2729629 RepID=A0A7Y0L6W3_9FIRM|nr:GTPase Era [Sulfobacillus harzensis]NMP23019.1 GTPase Era [Sulfobacillus harzensis]
MAYKSGFVALVGRPNVGKSTLLNALLGRKVAIATPKPQTTRNRIVGILHRPGAQVVLVDTPGVHRAEHKLGERMNKTARLSAKDADLIWHIIDLSRAPNQEDRWVANMSRESRVPVWLVMNKADLVESVKERWEPYRALMDYQNQFVVSAARETGLSVLVDETLSFMPEGDPYYPPDMVTDQSEDFYIAEVVREQVLELTREEIPYSVAVTVEERTARKPDLTYIRATIFVEREGQKGILIGEGGRMLKEIGRRARGELEAYYGHQVFLDLWVKTRERWRDQDAWLRRLGYEEPER